MSEIHVTQRGAAEGSAASCALTAAGACVSIDLSAA